MAYSAPIILNSVKVGFPDFANRMYFALANSLSGLYRGYKNRNKQLDPPNEAPPSHIAASSTPLANQDFADIDSEEILQSIYDYLYLKYRLLDRVIRARKLHHSRFFSLNLDYGHQHYLDTLSNQRFIVVRALERLERRVVEVLYEKQKWQVRPQPLKPGIDH